jgi:hypothetical protein
MAYYELYLKYKSKYIGLKNQNQKGGNPYDPIDIVSFNILNTEFNYVLYLFKNYEELIKELYQNEITKKEIKNVIKNLVRIERKEFELYRKNKLLIVIDKWLKSNQIICLQEVSTDFLKELTCIYKNNLISTKSTGTNSDDYRVIIIPDLYQIVKTDKIVFDNGIKIKECLVGEIKNEETRLVIFNLHIHWQSKPDDYVKFAELIKNYMELNYSKSIPFIICGDFNNNNISLAVQNFIKQFNQDKISLYTNSITYSDDFTSINPQTNKLDWIDHILSHGLICHSPTQTTNQIDNYKIFYDSSIIIKELINANKLSIKTKDFVVTKEHLSIFNSNNFVSDHKPVFASFGLPIDH